MFPSQLYNSVGQITNTLIYSSNWWEAGGATGCVAAYAAKGAASYAASKVNLVSPGTYDLTEVSTGASPSWSAARGWYTWIGKVFDTGIYPGIGTWTVICSVANCTNPPPVFSAVFGATGIVLGVRKYLLFAIQTNYGGAGPRYYAPNGTTVLEPFISSSAVYAIAGQTAYKNGVLATALMGTPTMADLSLKIGAYQEPDSSNCLGRFYADICAFAVYNTTLSAAQVAAVSAAMAAI